MLVKKIKIICLALCLFSVVAGLIAFLALDCFLVQRWYENQEIEKAKIVKQKWYEWDKIDYAGKGFQYEFKDGKFQLIKGVK